VSTPETRRVTPEHHHDHRDVTGGWLRPAVFGVMDGLVSNTALIAGVAAGVDEPRTVLIAGFAGLAALVMAMTATVGPSCSERAETTRPTRDRSRITSASGWTSTRPPRSPRRPLSALIATSLAPHSRPAASASTGPARGGSPRTTAHTATLSRVSVPQ